MTENEALEKHKKDCRRCRDKACKYGVDCLQKKDIEVYEELLAYRAIGTVEEFKDLKIENSELHCELQAIKATIDLFEIEIRAKAIDEFAEKLYNKSTDLKDIESDGYGMLHYEDVYEVAEQLKGGAE